MIKLENVNKYYNRHKKNELHVINNTSLDFGDTGLVALLGNSGCGKTTLLNAIGGLDKVKSGKIIVNGKKINSKNIGKIDKIRNLSIGYIFQNYNLIEDKTVFENVALVLKMQGIKSNEEIKKRVNYVLETLGIYRYRNRYANMLSGGERQRVGIARAIVKNPSIIIADEPTGNLDSANTLEIMNIIKSISKNRLVILVTHETDIAKFYADRIIELVDGKVEKDYINQKTGSLDYRVENKFYLKDFKYQTSFENKDNEITIYNNKQNDIKLTIVVKNNNIYIKANKNSKIEVIDENSNIEFINDHYKEIDKSIYEKYEFKYDKEIDTKKLKYKSIFNPLTMISNGFKKVFGYSIIKKLLLLGFLASGAFVSYCVSNIFGILNVKDSYFITQNRDYYVYKNSSIKLENYLKYEKFEGVDYILPGNDTIYFKMEFPYYYQTLYAQVLMKGSITGLNRIKNEDIVIGRYPENNYEIVVDKMVLDELLSDTSDVVMVGHNNYESFLEKEVELKNMNKFTIVGISEKEDPSIYVSNEILLYSLYNSYDKNDYYDDSSETDESRILDYNYVSDLNLKKGRLPLNEYEVIVNEEYQDEYPLNKEINVKVSGKKLIVVGYYSNDKVYNILSNENTIKYMMIDSAKQITVAPILEEKMKESFEENRIQLTSTYESARQKYIDNKKDTVKAGLIASEVILAISFVEIYLMIRSSFLSRIKEIGIYRAIGVKRSDIYKMFFGEIFAISTIACVPGALFSLYSIKAMMNISYFEQNYIVNPLTVIVSIIIIYAFNLFVGLLPVYGVVRQTPSQILSRKDID